MTDIVKAQSAEIEVDAELAMALASGDYRRASPAMRLRALKVRCEAHGLDIRTAPFKFIDLPNGKTIMYADKGCTESLSLKHKLSYAITEAKRDGDHYIVRCRISGPDGRYTDSTGVVWLKTPKGDDLANAIMKTETKAHRRGVLRHCGLGALDESEIESIPGAKMVESPPTTIGAIEEPKAIGQEKAKQIHAVLRQLGKDTHDLIAAMGLPAEAAERVLEDWPADTLEGIREQCRVWKDDAKASPNDPVVSLDPKMLAIVEKAKSERTGWHCVAGHDPEDILRRILKKNIDITTAKALADNIKNIDPETGEIIPM